MKSSIASFRLVALLEGISFILLLFVAMPLKYMYGMPEAVKIVGMTHGILFIGYLTLQTMAAMEHEWNLKTNAIFFLASLIPFGTFVTDRRLKAMQTTQENA
jgi:integral membrane protein